MKHCHFSIVYNELPFLQQKMPFLYEHFDQLIFYDLHVVGNDVHYSTDGSHDFIAWYPDPERKITLIEKRDLSDVTEYKGHSYVGKQKMFAVGSQYVKSDMDVFWWHGPEHLPADDVPKTMDRLEALAEKMIIIGCPWGYTQWGAIEGNPHEVHRSHWDYPLFEARGYETECLGKINVPKSNITAVKRVEDLA